MAVTAILAMLGTSLYFCSKFQTIKSWDIEEKKEVIITKAFLKQNAVFLLVAC